MRIVTLQGIKSINKKITTLLIGVVFACSFVTTTVKAGGGGDYCADGIPNAYFSVAPGYKAVGSLEATLDGSNSIACDSPIVSYRWDLGDGSFASGSTVTHTFTVGTFRPSLTVTDASGQVNTYQSNDIQIKESNQNPLLTDDSAEVLQGETINIDISANGSDPDGDDISNGYYLPGDVNFGSSVNTGKGYVYMYSSTGHFRYSAQNNASGTDTFTVGLKDGFGGIGTATVSVSIAPHVQAVEDSATTTAGVPVTIQVLANDYSYNNEPFEIYWSWGSNDGAVVKNADETFTFTPNAGFVGSTHFEYGIKSTVPDTWRVSTTRVNVEVLPMPNRAPVASSDMINVDEDGSVTANVLQNDSDPDGDTFTASLVSGSQNGLATLSSAGVLSYTPNGNHHGSDSVSYQLTDSQSNISAVATVSISVKGVNDVPLTSSDSATTNEDENINVNVLANDGDVEDGQNLAVSIVGSPANGMAIVNSNGTITYTPRLNYYGSDTIAYRVTDSDGASANASVSIAIASVNDSPTANFNWSFNNGGQAQFNASGSSDIDGQIVSYLWDFGDGSSVTTSTANVSHKYTRGSYLVTLTVTDNNGANATKTLTVTR